MESDAAARARRARRALAERREGGRVRALDPRLGAAGPLQQIQGLPELRSRAAGAHRDPGPRRSRELPEHQDSRAESRKLIARSGVTMVSSLASVIAGREV